MGSRTKTAMKNIAQVVRETADLFLPDDHAIDYEEDIKYIQRQVLEAFILSVAEMMVVDTDMALEDAKTAILFRIAFELSDTL